MEKSKALSTILLKYINQSKLNLASMHHIQGLMYAYGIDTSDEYKTQFIRQWNKNEKSLKEFQRLRSLLDIKIKDPCLLKGASLLDDIYPEYGSRFMCDIDFLIEASDLESWKQVFTNQGYQRTTPGKKNEQKIEWSKFIDGDEIVFELHLQIYEGFKLDKKPKVISSLVMNRVNQLELHEKIIHMCSHVSIGHNFLKLYWLIDLYLIFTKYSANIDYNKLRLLAKNYRCQNGFETTLFVLNMLFDMELKPRFKLAQLFINIDLILGDSRRSLRYIFLKVFIRDRLYSSFIYLKKHILDV